MLASMEGIIGGEGALAEERGESYAVLSKRWGIEDEGGDSQVGPAYYRRITLVIVKTAELTGG